MNFPLIFFFIASHVSASLILFDTLVRQLPMLLIRLPDPEFESKFDLMRTAYYEHGNFCNDRIQQFIQEVSVNCPGSCFVNDQLAIISLIPSVRVTSAFAAAKANISPYLEIITNDRKLAPRSANSAACPCQHFENRFALNIEDWKESSNFVNCEYLPVTVKPQSLVKDAVASYKAFDRIPFLNPFHLFHRSIRVNYKDEMIGEILVKRSQFYADFFRELIESSGLFIVNEHGFISIAPGIPSQEDLDTYEAFGFYLAKAFQNGHAFGYQFSPVITEMLKFGKLQSITESKSASANHLEFKFFESIDHVQLLMLALGFSRACPAHLLAKYKIDLNFAFTH